MAVYQFKYKSKAFSNLKFIIKIRDGNRIKLFRTEPYIFALSIQNEVEL